VSLYSIALFIHVIATMAMFIVIGIVMVSVSLMRQAQTAEQLHDKVVLAHGADKLMAPILLLVLIPAIYMVFATWGWTTAWINTALISLVLVSPLGPAVNARRLKAIYDAVKAAPVGQLSAELLKQIDDQVLWASCCIFTGVLTGIVFLMTVKPGLIGSIATIVVSLLLGIIASVLFNKTPAKSKSPSYQ
jgi:hypothetical protein